MATNSTTITTAQAGLPFSLTLAHHDASYLPIEKFKTIDGLLKSHAGEREQTPLICYPKNGAADFEEHSAADIDRFVDAAAQFYLKNGLQAANPELEQAPVVALLATTSFEYAVSFFAINRLGWTALFLSTRLAAPAYARLLKMADCKTLIIPEATRGMVDEICKDRPGCVAIPMLQRKDYRDVPQAHVLERKGVDLDKEKHKMAWILHSSGSTGLPKPIFLTNLACLANFRKSFGLRCFCVSPLFHSHGLMELGRAFYTRAPMYLGNHAIPVTSANLIEAMAVAQPQQVSAVPYVLQLLAEKEEGVQALTNTKLVLFGGSSCPDELGDRLVAQGVNLVANYGCTEIGQIMTSFRPPGDNDWQYFRLLPPAADFTLMDEIAPGVFECVGLDGLLSKGPTHNTVPPYSASNPEGAYRSGDLFTRHPDPSKSNHYKYLSRLDDRITLVNGEKVLPIPMENTIRQDTLVREAVVFGFQRAVPGILIFRSDVEGLELSDMDFLATVWPSVEKANINTESFSRVPKEMIVVIGSDVMYPRTDKGTFIRAQVYQQFSEEISGAYDMFDSGSGGKSGVLALSVLELEQWLLLKFREELLIEIPDSNSDIFSAGVDSLQTTRLWRSIKKEIDLGEYGSALSQNIVFEKGTTKQLAKHLYQLRIGERILEDEDEIEIMKDLIDRYSSFSQHFPNQRDMPDKQTVLVTGATGNLGAFIVAELAQRPDVAQVWALVRASGQAVAGSRLMHALFSRSIKLTESQTSKIYAVPSDLSKANLGLESHVLGYLLSSLTCVIHSAWAVNFNLGVRSFEAQHIRGTYNLINLCLRSQLPDPARFYFCSSISAASGTLKPARIPEAAIEDLNQAQKTGYGRSKLVTEQITRNAMRNTGIQARVLRIGQLSGDTVSADWNETEAIALMIRSALSTGTLPDLDERPSWLPVDHCARVITELALRSSQVTDADLVYHLTNPKTFSFRHDLLPALKSSRLPSFEVVCPKEWLENIASSEQDLEKNPSVKLLDFWRRKYSTSSGSAKEGHRAGLVFETDRTVQDCLLLGTMKDPVTEGLIERYVDVWLKKWSR